MNRLLVQHSLSTYFMRVAEELPDFELHAGDVLVVDRSLKPTKTDLVVVAKTDDPELRIAAFKTIDRSVELWGVVTSVIRSLRQ